MPGCEAKYYESPRDWKDDIRFFRLGVLCWYVVEVLGVKYREDHRDVKSVLYTNPSDLFLNGIMDTRRGTCGNMAALHVAVAWRLGWPVSLACVRSHLICRYDDGHVTHNIEATQAGSGYGTGGFKSIPGSGFVFADTIFHDRPHPIAEPFGLNRFIEGRFIDESVAAAVAH